MFSILTDKFGTTFVTTTVFEALGSPTLLCILGSRMFFNLKKAGEHGVNIGTNWSSYSHSAIRFDQPQDEGEQYVDHPFFGTGGDSAIMTNEPANEAGEGQPVYVEDICLFFIACLTSETIFPRFRRSNDIEIGASSAAETKA